MGFGNGDVGTILPIAARERAPGPVAAVSRDGVHALVRAPDRGRALALVDGTAAEGSACRDVATQPDPGASAVTRPERDGSRLERAFIKFRSELERFIAKRTRCPQAAEDIATEIYIKLDRSGAYYGTSEADARGYLFGMARHVTYDHLKIAKRRVELLEEEGSYQDSLNVHPEVAFAARSDLSVIDAALTELPEKARDILYEVRVNGCSHEEAADKLGVSVSCVEKYLARTLRHLRIRMREAEEDLPRSSGGWYGELRDKRL